MNHHVLIVDDDPGDCRLLADMLDDLGYRADIETGGPAALARLAEGAGYNAVLIDLVMPEMDGMGVLERLPRLIAPAPPVIAMVPERGADLARSAARVGACDYLTKPIDRDRLHFVLKNAIRLWELERAVGRRLAARSGGQPGTGVAQGRQPPEEVHDRSPDAADTADMRHYDAISLLHGSGQVRSLKALEIEIIRFSLDHYHGRLSEVARRLGIGRSTLYRKLKEHKIAISGAV